MCRNVGMAFSALLFMIIYFTICFANFLLICIDNVPVICWRFALIIHFTLLYQLVYHDFLGCLLRNSFLELQSDDVKLYDNQSEYWRTFLVPDDIAVKHSWQTRILKATSQGLDKLMASLTYFTGHQETKEVLPCISLEFCACIINFFLILSPPSLPPPLNYHAFIVFGIYSSFLLCAFVGYIPF